MPNEVDNFQESAPPIDLSDESDAPEQAQPEQKQAAAPVEAPPAQRRKVRFGDQELDLDDEEFKKLNSIEMVRGGQEALRKAAEMRKQADRVQADARKVIKALKDQPDWALKSVGMSERDQVAWAEKLLAQEMIRSGINPQTGQPMSPEQIQLYQLQQERDQRARQMEEYEKEQTTRQREEAKGQLRQRFDREMTEALRSGGLPPTDNMIGRLAQAVLDFDFEVPAKDLVPVVMEDFRQELEHTFKNLTPADILSVLPKGVLDELRKHDLAQARQGPPRPGSGKPQVIPGNRDPNRPAPGQRRRPMTNPQDAQRAIDEWARR